MQELPPLVPWPHGLHEEPVPNGRIVLQMPDDVAPHVAAALDDACAAQEVLDLRFPVPDDSVEQVTLIRAEGTRQDGSVIRLALDGSDAVPTELDREPLVLLAFLLQTHTRTYRLRADYVLPDPVELAREHSPLASGLSVLTTGDPRAATVLDRLASRAAAVYHRDDPASPADSDEQRADTEAEILAELERRFLDPAEALERLLQRLIAGRIVPHLAPGALAIVRFGAGMEPADIRVDVLTTGTRAD